MSVKSKSKVQAQLPELPLFSEYSKTTGKFFLKMQIPGGKDKRITNNGSSISEFEALLIDEKTSTTVVRRHIDTYNWSLYIVNYEKGEICYEIRYGTKEVKYQAEQHALYFSPMNCKGVSTLKSYYVKKYGQPLTHIINIPSHLPFVRAQVKKQDTIVIKKDGTVETHPLMVLSTPEIGTAAKQFADASNPGIKKAKEQKKRTK